MIALSGVPADIEFTGLRPGEKLHESLITDTESLLPTEHDKILRVDRVVVPEPHFDEDIRALINHAQRGRMDAANELIERLAPGFSARDSAESAAP
jgi:FlaA1/EpsC-like NDP-sugar epimerase